MTLSAATIFYYQSRPEGRHKEERYEDQEDRAQKPRTLQVQEFLLA
jgi:hypothetical protein